jgi:ubiquinone/menaquinone biosynthesis C-methylase UbiE
MKYSTLKLLICPTCRGEFTLDTAYPYGMVATGVLTCSNCQITIPIQQGIPHFIKEEELTGLNKPFARMYDWFSWTYSAFSKIGFLFLGTTEAKARLELLSLLEPNGGKVLEVSIGPGVNLPFLLGSPQVGEVFGLDISIGQLNRCNSLIRRKGWPVDLFLANGEELPFRDDSFDSVFHIGGINFFTNQQKAINEMIRVAKSGSRLIICDENESGAQWYEKFLPGFKSAFKGKREEIITPIDLIPPTMLEIKLENIWNDFMYCIEFRKPLITT